MENVPNDRVSKRGEQKHTNSISEASSFTICLCWSQWRF